MLYFITIFLSAMLLFLVQPMIAKVILPSFGGGSAVWTTCMLFFQCLLLGGYCYAHGLIKWVKPKQQVIVHIGVLLLALVATPLAVGDIDVNASPQMTILLILLAAIGLPYFVLSANAPLMQQWFSYQHATISPYKLYALSNIGSLLGLLLYPFVVEPFVSLEDQLMMWSIGYWAFALCCTLLALRLFIKADLITLLPKSALETLSTKRVSTWVLLSAFGVVALLAVTSSMSQNISSIPFLWLLPLVIYLLSFIICFGKEAWTSRKVWYSALVISLPFTFLLYFFASVFPIALQVLLYSFIIASVCMVCHGELVQLKPAANRLTAYYLAMSVGGVVGGLFVSFIAPIIFDQFVEFPLIVWSSFLVGGILSWQALKKYRTKITWTTASISIATLAMFVFVNAKYQQYDVVSDRNFYGQLAVKDIKVGDINERRLVDGTTSHGTQSLDKALSTTPLSYFRKDTGVAGAISALQDNGNIDVTIIGLGAGTLAAYGREGDRYHFLELNPMVGKFAQEYFTYVSDSAAVVDITIGDGRALLQQNQQMAKEQSDLLVIDAFSSDAIPLHLLTIEAFDLYRKRVKERGIVAIHISNNHLDFVPLIYGIAKKLGLHAEFALTAQDGMTNNMAQWVLLANEPEVLNHIAIDKVVTPWPSSISKPIIWTDDYSNLLSVLK